MPHLDRSPGYVAAFLGVLVVAQGAALATQLADGYRPFAHAPVRVPLSWDMFATAISRCDVRWDPPLGLGGKTLASLHGAGQPLEWDPVYDRVRDYQFAARAGCARAAKGTQASLVCFTNDGETVRDSFRCR